MGPSKIQSLPENYTDFSQCRKRRFLDYNKSGWLFQRIVSLPRNCEAEAPYLPSNAKKREKK